MGWRSGEVWLETDVLWFRERPTVAVAVAGDAGVFELPRFGPVETGLDASRRRRLQARTERRRRLATRTVPALALVLGSATMLPIGAMRQRGGASDSGPLVEDPPSLTFRLDDFRFRLPERGSEARAATPAVGVPRVEWRHATSVGLQYAGHLHDGTQLPVDGPDWVTWNPSTDSSPNLPSRLFGHERTIRAVLSVVAAYRDTYPNAPRVVIGDISFRDGGRMDQHVSHQNGLDVDVYYPRLDRQLRAPTAKQQVDRRLAQALLDGFVAAGAKVVFVGFSTGLRGDSGVVVPYPNHENHMHVRFPAPR